MAYQVRTEVAAPRALAAVRAVTTPQRLGTDMIAALDQVWPLLREQGARHGHNIVIYYVDQPGELTIDAGVEVLAASRRAARSGRSTRPRARAPRSPTTASTPTWPAPTRPLSSGAPRTAASGRAPAGRSTATGKRTRPSGAPTSTSSLSRPLEPCGTVASDARRADRDGPPRRRFHAVQ